MQRVEGDQALHSNAKAFQLQDYFLEGKEENPFEFCPFILPVKAGWNIIVILSVILNSCLQKLYLILHFFR